MKCLYLTITLLLMVISFSFGASYGVMVTGEKFMGLGMQMLDIQLNEQARAVLINNPELMTMAIKNYKETINPFKDNPQAQIHFQACMLEYGNATSCEEGLRAKYGKEVTL